MSSSPGILEIDTPLLPVTQLIAHPGTNPTLVVPVVGTTAPDVEAVWRHLSEPADFFGVPMPGRDDLGGALADRLRGFGAADVHAVTVTLFAVAGRATLVHVRADAVRPSRPEPVRIAVLDASVDRPGADAPYWRRMAARTTSRARTDHLGRRLADLGCVDAVPPTGAPHLGALVFRTPTGLVGLDRVEPASILDQLGAVGLVVGVTGVEDRPGDATAAWWISPGFETHPVAGIGGTPYETAAQTFLEDS